MTTNKEEIGDDALQELLDEADNLMHDLNTNDGEDADLVIDGFAIDSDGEDEIQNETLANGDKPVNDHPLSEELLKTPAPAPPPPLSFNGVVGYSPNGSNTGMMGTTLNGGSVINASPLATSATMDNFKQQTTRFASNLASMAQRAASQVAAATAVQPGPMMVGQPHLHQPSMPASPHIQNYQHTQQPPQARLPGSMHNTAPSQAPQNSHSAELDKDQISKLLEDHVGDLLQGERIIMFVSNLLHVSDTSGVSYAASQTSDEYMWCCAMSYYRIILFSTANPDQHRQMQVSCPSGWDPLCWEPGPEETNLLEIPLASIDRVEKTVYQAGGSSYMGLILYAKESGRSIRFTTPSYADTGRAFESLQTYAFPGRRNLGYLFAFESKRQKVMASVKVDETTGQQTITIPPTPKRFDPMIEFPRLMARTSSTQCPWMLWCSINANYAISPTYPSVLVGPATLDDNKQESFNIIRQCAAFRSEQRLPSLTWCGTGGASIWRCSQPKVGLQGNRSPADELFLRHIAESARGANAIADPPPIYSRASLQRLTGDFAKDWTPEPGCGLKILDLRPRSSAMANRTGGACTKKFSSIFSSTNRRSMVESDSDVGRRLTFLSLRDSIGYGYENTSNYSNTTIQFCNIGNIHAVRDSYQRLCTLCTSGATVDVNWNPLVEDTKWLSHIRSILSASWETAYWVHLWRMPVLLHCSHGWDRTSQVSALAQLLLDPYYRTCEGFSVLVEKDFMSFGHPFHTRCGHGEGRSDNKTVSSTPTSGNPDEGQVSPIFMQFLDCVYQIIHLYPECFEFNTKYLLELSNHIYSCRFGSMLCDTERERESLAGIRQRTYAVWDHLDNKTELKNPAFEKSQRDGILLMPLPMLLRNVKLWPERHCQMGPKAAIRVPLKDTVA